MYCIVFGVGFSPNTGNEGRFVFQVTKRALILGRRHSWLSMIELLALLAYVCIHFTSSCAIRPLGQHASRYVIGGTRIEDYSLELMQWRGEWSCTHMLKILCHAPFLLSIAANRKPAAKTGQQPFGALYSVLGLVANRGKSGHRDGFSGKATGACMHSLSFQT